MKNKVEIKLIALDIDGTLLNEKNEITGANRTAIKQAQEKGVWVVLSTGRSYINCRAHADSLSLDSYLLTANGGEIRDEKRQLVSQTFVKTESIQWVLNLANRYQSNFWSISTQGPWYNEMPEDLYSTEWLKFGFYTDDDDARKKILEELKQKGEFELSNSSLKNIEVNPKGISKGNGLQFICDRLGIRMSEVMAVGDSLNDLSMIKAAGIGVAMGNAQEAVKEEADWITESNEEDGVAKAIKKWVLGEK